MDTDAQVIKRGEEVIRVSLRRAGVGMRLTVKVVPAVEELLREWGANEARPVSEYGRNWLIPRDKAGKPLANDPLMVWDLQESRMASNRYDGGIYRLDLPGYPLLGSGNNGDGSISLRDGQGLNMSFLRLVGASQDLGVTFDIKGVYSLEYLRDLAGQIRSAGRKLYTDYLLPIDLTVFVSTQEARL